MTAPVELVEDITSMDPDIKLKSVRAIKNSIIGNRTKKELYVKLGTVPKLVDILMHENDDNLLIQAAAALGSFGCGSRESIQAVVNEGGVQSLVKHLTSSNEKVLETVTRSLKIIYESKIPPRDYMFKGNTIKVLINLLQLKDEINELVASLLAKCCETREQQNAIASAGGVDKLTQQLYSKYPKSQEAALDALASLSRDNLSICEHIISKEDIVSQIINLAKERRPTTRLLAVKCIANLNKAKALQEKLKNNEIITIVLPTIVKLFHEEGIIREEAPLVLANLIEGSEELQTAACDVDAVTKLTNFLKEPNINDRMKENVLSAISALCSLTEEGRKQVIESKILPIIVQSLDSKNERIRMIACECARGLSRSVKQLRTSLVDAGIATPLFKLLDDTSSQVQAAASATLCNIVLDFSPMKKVFIEKKGVQRLVEFTQSMDQQLRLNSVWALKNLVFRSESAVKEAVMKELTYEGLFKLLNDSDSQIQEQAMNLIRNLAFGEAEDVTALLKGGGQQLIDELLKKLDTQHLGVLIQTLYVICNIAAGNEEQKKVVMQPDILKKVLGLLKHEHKDVIVGAVWVLINLTWKGDEGIEKRKKYLKDLGCKEILQGLLDNSNIDVRDRAKQALEQLQ